ncbi:hypothetical protein A3Q56_05336, partial [Intoshia linei]
MINCGVDNCLDCVKEKLICTKCTLLDYKLSNSICKRNNFVVITDNFQGHKCNSTTFYEIPTNQCTKCKSNCQMCTSKNDCRKCSNGYYLNYEFSCEYCDYNCAVDFCHSKYGCTKCKPGYWLFKNMCNICKDVKKHHLLIRNSCYKCVGFYYDLSCHKCEQNQCEQYVSQSYIKIGFFDRHHTCKAVHCDIYGIMDQDWCNFCDGFHWINGECTNTPCNIEAEKILSHKSCLSCKNRVWVRGYCEKVHCNGFWKAGMSKCGAYWDGACK